MLQSLPRFGATCSRMVKHISRANKGIELERHRLPEGFVHELRARQSQPQSQALGPVLAALRDKARSLLDDEPKLLLLSGWPIEAFGEQNKEAYRSFAESVGTLLPQSRDRNDQLGVVQPVPGEWRGHRSTKPLRGHTDSPFSVSPPTLVSMLYISCGAVANEGLSTFHCGEQVAHHIQSRSPDSMDYLSQGFYYAVSPDQVPKMPATYTELERLPAVRSVNGQWHVQFSANHINQKVLDSRGAVALEALVQAVELQNADIVMQMQPGDVVLFNNQLLFHGRTEFTDHNRLCYRAWINA